MTDDADTIQRKIKKAKTDPDHLPESVQGLDGRPEARNLLGIYAALADVSIESAVNEFAGQQFSALKDRLSDVAVANLAPMQDAYRRLLNDKGQIDAYLAHGAERARAIAGPVLREVQDVVGFLHVGKS